VYLALGIFQAIREIVPPPYSDWRIWNFLPDWSFWTWLSIFLALLLLGTVEAAYTQWKVHESSNGAKLIGISEEWKRPTNTFTTSSTVALLVMLFIVFMAWARLDTSPLQITIREVDIGWIDDKGVGHGGGTDYAEPDKQWAANIHYVAKNDRGFVWKSVTVFTEQNFSSQSERTQWEDQAWEQALAAASYSPFHFSSDSPEFLTINGLSLSRIQLDKMIDGGSLYFMMVVGSKRTGEPKAEVCVCRQGISPVIHRCGNHNWP
jgi:hypothetical protein